MTEADLPRPIVVYHVAAMGDWRDVAREQLALLADAGFGTKADPVRVTFVGRGLEEFWTMADAAGVAIEVARADDNTDHYETFALLEIERLAKREQVTRPVLYCHTKGVSNPGDPSKRRWRVLMDEHVIRRWRVGVAAVAAGASAAGVGVWEHGERHFSGNYWIASPDWLRRLPDYTAYHHAKNLTRYSCEMYIGAAAGFKPHELFLSNQVFWHDYDFTGHVANLTELPDATPDLTPQAMAARPELVVITAVSRPGNLGAAGYSLRPLQRYFRLRWVLVADLDKTTPQIVALSVPSYLREFIQVFAAPGDGRGMAQKNHGLDFAERHFPEAWVYVLDDDNAIHQNFPQAAAGAVAAHPTAAALVFGQAHADGTHRLDAGPVAWSRIDTASAMVRASDLNGARFLPYLSGVIGDDFVFWKQVYDRAPHRFRFIHKRATYYNKIPPWAFTKLCPVPTHQHLWELNELVGMVSLRTCEAGGTIVEIGSLYGGTLWHWLHMGLVERVASIDLPPRPSDPWYCPILHGDYREDCRAKWDEWAAQRHVDFRAITGDSRHDSTRAQLVRWLGGDAPAIDVLFIDGDHGTEAVLADWKTYSPLVKPGGMVAFHDVHGLPQVREAWEQIRKGRRTIEIVGDAPGNWGIGIVFMGEGVKP